MGTSNLDNVSPDVIKRASKIKVLLMDVDGCMTDGKLFYVPAPDGSIIETKGFNTQDGLGLHFCFGVGLLTGVISGRNSPATDERCKMLNMKYIYQGLLDKVETYEGILKDAGLTAEQAAFVGDDFTDVPLMSRSGLGVAVQNARPEVKSAANYVTETNGGEGAIREVIEIILKSQGLWEKATEKYFSFVPATR